MISVEELPRSPDWGHAAQRKTPVPETGVSVLVVLHSGNGRFCRGGPQDAVGTLRNEAVIQAPGLSEGVSFDGIHNLFGSLRVRYFGPRPLIEDHSVRSDPSTLVNTQLGLPGETEAVEDVHFHPAEKRSARLVVDWRF